MIPENRFETNRNPNELKTFFEEKVFPYLSDSQKDELSSFADIKPGKEFLREDYERILNFDPSDKKNSNFFMVLIGVYLISQSDPIPGFENTKQVFIAKTKMYAEYLFRNAFFRNSYNNIEAWQSCRDFKEYQALFRGLNLMPEHSEQRIAGMTKELDELWSQPEVERALQNEIADEYVESGASEKSALVQIFRKESAPITKDEYDGYHELRPDLFPERYVDYLQLLEDLKHPFRLKL